MTPSVALPGAVIDCHVHVFDPAVKLSSLVKLSARVYPHADSWRFARALIDAYSADWLVWASDWPFLRAPVRIDYGPLLGLMASLPTDDSARQAVLRDTPRRLFGFASTLIRPARRPGCHRRGA